MRNYIVAGGSSGIGLQIVRKLIAEGNEVSVLSRTWRNSDSLPSVNHYPFDALTDEINLSDFPPEIHGLAYCPGSINLRSIRALSIDTMRDDFELNVIGGVRVIQSLLKSMKAASASGSTSSIVLFSTVAVAQGLMMHASVAAAKGAIEALTRTLAADLCPNIRVNCIAPALTDTPLAASFFANSEKAQALAKMYPLGRTGTTEDIASAACFLLGNSSDWITGQVIGVDGGMSNIKK